tara:strand:- start:650 stop:877 length:228 start_codon:yes stop_codon:yes gene_type:complete
MEEVIIKFLKKRYKKKKLKIDRETFLLNGGLDLDSIEFIELITFLEKKTKKKFNYKFNQNLSELKVVELSGFFVK